MTGPLLDSLLTSMNYLQKTYVNFTCKHRFPSHLICGARYKYDISFCNLIIFKSLPQPDDGFFEIRIIEVS